MIDLRSRAAGRPVRILAVLAATALFAAPGARAQDDAPCRMCHFDAANFSGVQDSALLAVSPEAFKASVHAQAGMPCTSCHAGLSFPHPENPPIVKCGACHSDVASLYDQSLHGYALSRGNDLAPTCTSCHGVHDILRSSNPDSRTNRNHIAATCAGCHGGAGVRTADLVRIPATFLGYAASVHGRAVAEGNRAAATCVDCHGVHDLKGPADPSSKINRLQVASTCGTCHREIREEYETSIHGRALAAGLADSPTCNDCHGEHRILSPENERARTHGSHIATELCADCHDNPDIIEKYGLQGGVVGSYEDSYHFWATRLDAERAATCVSCHTAHHILPASDPASTVSAGNVTETCRQCHADATPAFAASYDHVAASIAENPVNRVLRAIYVWLIAIVIGGMALHNLLIFGRYLIDSWRRHRSAPSVRRFSGNFLLQHGLLLTSFLTLVVTGFALRYTDAWWVGWLEALGLDERLRSTTHRVAGVALIVASVWHLGYLIVTRRGRRFLIDMLPRWTDFTEFLDAMRYYAGASGRKPGFGRFGYPEKAEYWALIWGTVLMAVTGIVLWFPTRAVQLFPSWIVTASQTVHFYEAWLATLAILVWHFFFVIFYPETYPISWTFLSGRMDEHEARSHHPRWWKEELEEERGSAAKAAEGQKGPTPDPAIDG